MGGDTVCLRRIDLTGNEIIAYLESERPRHLDIAETIDLHILILQARARVKVSVPKPALSEEKAKERLARGEPLFEMDKLALDWSQLGALFKTLCEVTARGRVENAQELAKLARMPKESSAEFKALVHDHLAPAEENTRSDLAGFLLNNALHPFLSAVARACQSCVDDEAWYRGRCPICGGETDFAALGKETGAVRLLCTRCDFEWSSHRSICPFCGTRGTLGYVPSGAYRLYTCENCRRYLKTIDLREMARSVNLPAERILTVGMDIAARNDGYRQ